MQATTFGADEMSVLWILDENLLVQSLSVAGSESFHKVQSMSEKEPSTVVTIGIKK